MHTGNWTELPVVERGFWREGILPSLRTARCAVLGFAKERRLSAPGKAECLPSKGPVSLACATPGTATYGSVLLPAWASGSVSGPFCPQVATDNPSNAAMRGSESRPKLILRIDALTRRADRRTDRRRCGAAQVVAGADGAFEGEHLVHVLVDLRV